MTWLDRVFVYHLIVQQPPASEPNVKVTYDQIS